MVDGNGSEYWFIDIARGVSRVQDQSASLQDFTNALDIVLVVKRLISADIPAEDIAILTL